MQIWKHQASSCRALLLVSLLWFSAAPDATLAAQPGQSILPMLEERFGLSEQQVRDALGALLVFTRERLPKTEFDELARTVPNADLAMQEVKQRGIVTKPIDDLSEYERALGNSGIPAAYAAEFAPAVLEALHATGHDRERDILARALN
jgi:hypothetical protein